ncbi:1-deoxy-D-xylulose-5-phosphate reductoisomerase [Bacillus thuringiensis serovar mexicanensis]|uniref:1-deoxy-D-xylulose 5-phosphate reductoisomerase n=2 Tax=Bacillus TaxID=1386 RepID=A0A2C9YER1_BACTU|nr:1-deoxy-D-xylulose 5-phosphate reductoisomerase [Bacillus thuringiensis serovar monterrey BGSC 4AJ1]OTW46531.1 1-deoxy-D-xylulose-5-phosphate reductoisomerase [Bacillus thuringiensis serovar mexicanensis]OTX06276.1 1-deoxy-D-xylulose-5-phosphate reductoisomerase [Bacillus thuringiensis serovar monterrey]
MYNVIEVILMRNIVILGSTGSIGTSALEVIRNNPDKFRVVGMSAFSNIELFSKQIEEFKPEIISIGSESDAKTLKYRFPSLSITHGQPGLIEVAAYSKADLVLSAVVGSIGILPTIEALKNGKDIAIANKETLVAAGHIVTATAEKYKRKLIPVDSEHSAIFQCLNGENEKEISNLIITASGGAFRDKSRVEMINLKASEALKHPNWQMGAKLTIDSATLMNKGLEVIEAHWLFNIPYEKIQVLVHKESIIHSMVEFQDGSIMAQLGQPDMKTPIQYSFTYPNRLKSDYHKLKLSEIRALHFEEPNLEKFPCLKLAYDAGKIGGTMPAVLNAANEIVNKLYREDIIKFLDIEKILYNVMSKHDVIANPDLNQILDYDNWARQEALKLSTPLRIK